MYQLLVYFGGLNGITAFHPNDFLEGRTDFNAPLVITNFHQLDGKTGQMVNKTSDISHSNQIVLKPEDGLFRLEFTLLDFKDP